VAERITWRPDAAAQPLVIDLAQLFARIHGDRTG
jgi:hypothetical protein